MLLNTFSDRCISRYRGNCEVMDECDIVVIRREACIGILRSTPHSVTEVLVALVEWEIFLLRHIKPVKRPVLS
jgi:hypothetical protein